MSSRGLCLLGLALGPVILTACASTEAATGNPATLAPEIGVDLGSSARLPQLAGLAGEGEGYGRTEPGTTPMAHGSMPGIDHGSMAPGSMPGMTAASMPGMTHGPIGHDSMSGMDHKAGGNMQVAHSGHAHVQGTGTVNSVDSAAHKVNISHAPISMIGWPAMTMDFNVAPSVNLDTVKPGTRIRFDMQQEGGTYVIQSITPAGAGR